MVALLARNTKPSFAVEEPIDNIEEGGFYAPLFNPLGEEFKIPDWLSEKGTPWNLVSYFKECLERCTLHGETRDLVNGHRAELRPAKTLLSLCGNVQNAARVVKYTADCVGGPVTLYRAIDRVEEVKEKCQWWIL